MEHNATRASPFTVTAYRMLDLAYRFINKYPLYIYCTFQLAPDLCFASASSLKQHVNKHKHIHHIKRGWQLSNQQSLVTTCDWPATRFNRILSFLDIRRIAFETLMRWRENCSKLEPDDGSSFDSCKVAPVLTVTGALCMCPYIEERVAFRNILLMNVPNLSGLHPCFIITDEDQMAENVLCTARQMIDDWVWPSLIHIVFWQANRCQSTLIKKIK